MTTELADFPRRAQTIPRLDFCPLAQLPPALRAPRAASGPRATPVAPLDLDPLQFYALFRIPIIELDIICIIRPDTCHFSGIELAFALEVRFDPVALARLLRALRAPAAAPRTAARAAPVTPLLPRTPVGIGIGVEGFDVLGLEILIRISVVVPAKGTRHRRELEASDAESALHIYSAVRMDARHLAFVVPARLA